jgi:biopolymer transport protein ExbB/TolQ
MVKKKSNLISIIPAFLLMGVAVGIQIKSILLNAAIGLIVGIIIYSFLSYRNKRFNKK